MNSSHSRSIAIHKLYFALSNTAKKHAMTSKIRARTDLRLHGKRQNGVQIRKFTKQFLVTI